MHYIIFGTTCVSDVVTLHHFLTFLDSPNAETNMVEMHQFLDQFHTILE